MPPQKTTISNKEKQSVAVIAAAANLATSAVASAAADAAKTLAMAANDAVKILATAADNATKVVTDTATRTLAEFPNIQEDIRDLRAAMREDSKKFGDSLDSLLKTVAGRYDVLITRNGERITTLERWRWVTVGGGMVIGFVVANFGNVKALWQILRAH